MPGIVVGTAAEQLVERVARDVGPDGLPSAAISLRRGDEVLVDVVLGADDDARHHLWSVAKGLTSALLARLVNDDRLAIDAHVIDLLPWFTGEGKDRVRIRHLLLHTAGLARAPMRMLDGADDARRRERMRTWRVTGTPGEATSYHHMAAHWVLRDVVEASTGQGFEQAWQAEVAGPLGLDTLTFVPGSRRLPEELVAVGPATPPETIAQLAAQGLDVEALVAEADVDTLLTFRDEVVRDACSPGASAAGTARDVTSLLLALARRDPRLGDSEVLADFTTRVANDLVDPGFGIPASRSLGFAVAGADGQAPMRELPADLGPRVFGQPGAAGQVAWADPDTGLAFCFLTNGLVRDPIAWWTRTTELNHLAAAAAT